MDSWYMDFRFGSALDLETNYSILAIHHVISGNCTKCRRVGIVSYIEVSVMYAGKPIYVFFLLTES